MTWGNNTGRKASALRAPTVITASLLVWALLAPGGALAAGNTVNINNGDPYTHIFGNYNGQGTTIQTGTDPTDGPSSDNQLTVTSATVNGDVVGGQAMNGTGGAYTGSADAGTNTVTIDGGTFTNRAVFGGYTGMAGGDANGNTVTINALTGTLSNVTGGTSTEGGNANNNTVTVNAGTIGNIKGGMSNSGTANGNTATVSGGTISGDVSGGQGNNAVSNSVTVSNGAVVSGNIYGGIGHYTSIGNTVTIDASFIGSVMGNIIGGLTEGDAGTDLATSNVVTINTSGGTFSGGIYGGKNFRGQGDVFTGNTLNLAAGNTLGSVYNMNIVNFTSAGNAGIATLDTTATGAVGTPKVTLNTNAHNVAFGGAVTGSGGIDKTGTGVLTLSGANSYSGDTAINGGGLTVAGTLGSGAYAGAIANNGALVFDQSAAQTLSGVISGTGSLTKTGTGVLTLAGTNTYSGDTTVSGGGLTVTGALGSGKLAISGGILNIENLSIAHDKLGTDSLILTNNGQFIARNALTITGGSFINMLGGAIKTGKLVMDAGESYTHNTPNSLNIIGTAGGGAFFTGTNLTVSQGDVFLGSDATPSGTHTTTAAVTVGGGTLQVGHGNWQTGDLIQTGGQAKISGNSVLTVTSLNQAGGLLTVGGSGNTGKLVVDGSFANTTYSAGTAGVAVTGTGVLQAKYDELITGTDFKDTTKQKAINLAKGGTLLLSGYSGPGMTVSDFKILSGNLLSAGSTGTVQGINVDTSGASLQDIADVRLAAPAAVVDGSGGINNGAATVGGVTGATTVSGNAALTLTGQASGNVLADSGVKLIGGILTLGNPVGGSTGGMLQGGINAANGTNTINVVNGAYTVNGGITGGTGTTVMVGGSANSGTLIAADVNMNGGQISFDPPFVAAGDTSNASLGGLTFTSNTVDARMTVGQNSMVSLGSTDAEWLRTEVARYQSDGKGLWGQDVTAALALRTPQTLSTAGGINVDGTWVTGGSAATANTARFADKSLLVVDAAGVGSGVALSGEAGGASTLAVDSGAKLHIVGGQDGGTVNVTGGFGASTKDAASWIGTNLTTSTALLSATGGTFYAANGEYSVTLKANAAAPSFPLLSSGMAALVDRMVVQTGINPNSSNAGVRFISRAVSNNYIGKTDESHAAATIEGAAQMAAVGAVQGSTLSAATAASGAVTTRTSMALPRSDMSRAVAIRQDSDGSLSLDSGLSAGDGLKNGLGVWIMPLYQSNNVWGMKAENFKSGYNSNLGGIALGADYTINDMFRFGAAFNVGAGYAKSSGDFNSTDNSFNFWGVSLYGGWVYDNFGLSADVGYTGNYNKVEQDMPASMQMSGLKADVTSHAWNTGLKAEYKFNAGALDIIPHVGVRYLGLVTDGYDVKSGGTVFEVDGDTQSIWTFPVGVSFAKAIETESGWQFKPQLDLGVIPAAGDVKAKSKARAPGVDSHAEMKMQVVDYATFDGGLGFELGKGDFTLGLNYNLQASEHRTGHGVFGTLRYEF